MSSPAIASPPGFTDARASHPAAVRARPDAEARVALWRLGDLVRRRPGPVRGDGCSELARMAAGRSDAGIKLRAEGDEGIGLRGRGMGIAVEAAGGSKGGLQPAMGAAPDGPGVLDPEQRRAVAPGGALPLRNDRRTVTGDVRPLVELQRGDRLSPGVRSSPQPDAR